MPSIIHIDGAEMPITEIHFIGQENFYRKTDSNGRPNTPVSNARIEIKRQILYSPKAVITWLKESTGKGIKIELKEDVGQNGKTILTIELTNAFVVRYKIEHKENSEDSLMEVFEISAEKMSLEGVEFEWKFPS